MKNLALALTALPFIASASNAVAFEKGDILVRGGFATVAPDESSSNINVGDDLGFGLTIDNNTQLGLTAAYFITDRVNVEVLAATPFTHDVNFAIDNPLGTGNQLGEVTHLPPTVTVNYYFNDPSSVFQPYVGAGLNYTFIYDEQFTGANEEAGLSDLSLDNSFGLAAQAGIDYQLSERWFLNAAVRWIDIDTEASFNLGDTRGSVSAIEIDPFAYAISLGYRF
jgi:outer membrane protein